MNLAQEPLLVFHENLSLIAKAMNANVVRMASSREAPQNPLRPGKEVSYDQTGQWVLPEFKTGISLAASVKQLIKVFQPKRSNYLLLVDRHSILPRGLKFNKESEDHWMIVVSEKMTISDYNLRIQQVIQKWTLLGKFIRYD